MIDIENAVFTAVHDAIKEAYPDCNVISEPTEEVAEFPAVVVREINNSTWRRTLDNSPTENHALIVYDINTYSAKQDGRKAECKALLDIADGVMQGLGFVRILKTDLPNSNRTIHRMYGRWEGIVEQPEIDGDSKTYHVYRR